MWATSTNGTKEWSTYLGLCAGLAFVNSSASKKSSSSELEYEVTGTKLSGWTKGHGTENLGGKKKSIISKGNKIDR